MKKSYGIDIGAKSIRLIDSGDGVIASIPSAAARMLDGKEIVAYGREAVSMASRMPGSVELVYPLEDISALTPETAAGFIEALMKASEKRLPSHPILAIAAPGEQTKELEKTLLSACKNVGAEQVYLFDTLLAAYYGARMTELGQLVGLVNIGASYTEAAMFIDGELADYRSVKLGGNDIDRSIVNAVYRKYGVKITEDTAETLKKEIGTLRKSRIDMKKMTVTGRKRILGVPVGIEVGTEDIMAAFISVTDSIFDSIGSVFRQPKHEAETIVLTGGTARIHGLADAFAKEFEAQVMKPDEPENSVAKGIRIMLEKEKE